jgi:hypothetical protein
MGGIERRTGHGGRCHCGARDDEVCKTFLARHLLDIRRSRGKRIIAYTTTGIAAVQYEGGVTRHALLSWVLMNALTTGSSATLEGMPHMPHSL